VGASRTNKGPQNRLVLALGIESEQTLGLRGTKQALVRRDEDKFITGATQATTREATLGGARSRLIDGKHLLGPLQRGLDIGADVVLPHMPCELRLVHHLGRLRTGTAKD
jgi:hypothetical protein